MKSVIEIRKEQESGRVAPSANENKCVCCGAIIPEGRQVCPNCEKGKKFRRVIAVDFDNTLFKTEEWPTIGAPIYETIDYCKDQKAAGAVLILWTCRTGEDLKAAVEACRTVGLEFDYINENTPDDVAHFGNDSRKINASLYIDDRAIRPEDLKKEGEKMKKWHKETIEIIIHHSELLEFITQAQLSSYTVESFAPKSTIMDNDGMEMVVTYKVVLFKYKDEFSFSK